MLLLQACSTTNIVTTIAPGKELSKTSLGARELENRVILEEVRPLSVKLYRRVSMAEYIKTEYRAVKETRHETVSYDCFSAYERYPAFMLTTMGVPMFYELVTGFNIFKRMCNKNPPTYFIEKADTDKTLSRESFDNDKLVIMDTPLAGESVTVEIDGNKYATSTSKDGIATFPAKEFDYLNSGESSFSIDYQYNDVRLATPYRKQRPQEESIFEKNPSRSKSKRNAVSDDPSASSENDSSESLLQ